MMRLLLLSGAVLVLASCEPKTGSISGNSKSPLPEGPPAAGTVVAEDSIRHRGDGLNQFTFRVVVTKAPERGVYTVNAQDGPNKGETQFTLPKRGEDFQVVMHKDPTKARMAIGFQVPGDKAFYPYYEVVSEGKTIRAQYTNAYQFE